MKKIFEAKTLEEACALASKDLLINIDELDYKIEQYPSKGIFGLFAKDAIIEVTIKEKKEILEPEPKESEENRAEKEVIEKESIEDEKSIEEKSEDELLTDKSRLDDTAVMDSFYNKNSGVEQKKASFEQKKESIDAQTLESEIKRLFKNSCFNLDTIEVDIEDNTVYVFIDGDDAALLIGKEGYRYNALSYLLFNWINSKYGLYLKLEIAQFLASQQDMIVNQLKSVVEHVNRDGWGRTRELNGILVQIALEYLRDTFPNKYVAIKRTKEGNRYIVINEFNKR